MENKTSFAQERLLRDLKEIQEYVLPTVYALPLENNIFEWHANLIGIKGSDYEGTCIHLIFHFPNDYPMHPPKVELCTTVKRDHVYGQWICLDMLQSWGGFSQKKYTGWSTAYSTLSILLQLQSYLFEPYANVSTGSISEAACFASNFKCLSCHHNMKENKPFPWREGMIKPLTLEETKKKYSKEFQRQSEIEKELKEKVSKRKQSENSQKKEKLNQIYEKDALQRRAEMVSLIEKNKMILRNKEAEQAKQKEKKEKKEKAKQTQQKKEEEPTERVIPGDTEVTPKKKKKKIMQPTPENGNVQKEQSQDQPKPSSAVSTHKEVVKEPTPLTENDQLLKLLWNTKLSALATEFDPVPSNRRNQSRNNNIYNNNNNNNSKNNNSKQIASNKTASNSQSKKQSAFIFLLPPEILFEIFSYLTDSQLRVCSRVCQYFHSLISSSYIFERKETICFHSKRTWEEDVLGVGITIDRHPKTGTIQYITTRLDLISHTAFYKEGVRQSVWQEPFTHWIPLYINSSHWRRARKYLESSLVTIYNSDFKPSMVVDLYSKLMNTMVVNVMSGQLHASIIALQGYCYFHRLLIAIVQEFPALRLEINERVKNFILDETQRHKKVCPSIGDMLPQLTISDYTWKHLALPVVKETMIRNVLWIAKKHPQLAHLTAYVPQNEDIRVHLSFAASKTSLRLIMFHVYFLNSVARVGTSSIEQVASEYDSHYGLPTHQMQEDLQKEIFHIMNVDDFKAYFHKVKLPVPSQELLHYILRENVEHSLKKRYHRADQNAYIKKPEKPKEPKKKKNLRPELNMDDGYDY